MNAKRKRELKESIRMCKMKINTVQKHIGDNKPVLNESYNRLLIEHAVLSAELKSKKESMFSSLYRKFFRPEKKLICDYFK